MDEWDISTSSSIGPIDLLAARGERYIGAGATLRSPYKTLFRFSATWKGNNKFYADSVSLALLAEALGMISTSS